MKIGTKLDYAKRAVDSFVDHDDVIFEAVLGAAANLKDYIDAKVAAARERRAELAGVALADAEERKTTEAE